MAHIDDIDDRIKLFNEQKSKFKNHPLLTELPNVDTLELSNLAKNDIKRAIELLISIDKKSLIHLLNPLKIKELLTLQDDVISTINRGKKVFICGCGASGRLAVFLEYMWRSYYSSTTTKDAVIGLLAGGDNALIKSVEGFEDHSEYGKRQLEVAGFTDGDLVLAVTASGESPFVIGIAEKALEQRSKVYFIHCNTNDALIGRKNNKLTGKENIHFLSLYTVPMALTGSTRMQATTILTLCIALCLKYADIEQEINTFLNILNSLDLDGLEVLITKEATLYQKNEFLLFDTDHSYGITVLTDTTERSPTFNLVPFENQLSDKKNPSWSYLLFSKTEDSFEAWKKLLGRNPRTLDWYAETDSKTLYGFDFSKKLIDYRKSYIGKEPVFYRVFKENGKLCLELEEFIKEVDIEGIDPLYEQLILKIVLNISSTLVMGRLGFYEGNLMTSLNPSNSKLIDRAIRYIDFLLKERYGIKLEYDKISEILFKEMKSLKPKESIVLKSLDKILMEFSKIRP